MNLEPAIGYDDYWLPPSTTVFVVLKDGVVKAALTMESAAEFVVDSYKKMDPLSSYAVEVVKINTIPSEIEDYTKPSN